MQLGQAERFSLPNVAAPFVSVARIASAEGVPERNRPHYHPDTLEVCAVVRGQMDWFVGEEGYVVRPGEVVVVPENVVHGAVDANLQPCEIVVVHLALERLPPKLQAALSETQGMRLRHAPIHARLMEILAAHRQRGPYFEETVASHGTLLAVELAEYAPDEQSQNDSRLIRQAQRALMGREGLRPTVDDVAHRLGVSSVWLHKLFVRETGASPGDWARGKRLAEAKRRLAENLQSNVQIALELGYSSGQTFATAFRKESGMTPSEYRKRYAGGTTPAREVFRVDMRETWVDGVLVYPPISTSAIETNPSRQ